MSSNTSDHDTHHGLLSATTTVVPSTISASSSHNTMSSFGRSTSPYLAVAPSHPLRRRSSHNSLTFDVDESQLSLSDTLHNYDVPLLHTISTESTQPTTLRARIHYAFNDFYIANYGAFLVLISQFFGALMNLCTTLLEHSPSHSSSDTSSNNKQPTGMHPFQILFVRQSITSLLCFAWAFSTKTIPDFPFGPKNTKIRLLLVSRGVFGFFGVFGMYYSLLYLPLAEATVLTFLAPILTCYLCSYVLPDESSGFGRQQQIAGFVSLIGVVFIARPASLFSSSSATLPKSLTLHTPNNTTTIPDASLNSNPPPNQQSPTPTQHLNAILCSLLGVLGATGAMTSIRAIGNRAHPFLSINYFSVWCALVSLACLIIFPSVSFRFPSGFREWGLLLALGSCGFTMQWLLTAGLSYGGSGSSSSTGTTTNRPGDWDGDGNYTDVEDATQTARRKRKEDKRNAKMRGSGTRATSMLYMQMLFALGADKIVFGVSPSVWSWVGSALILTGAVWVAAATGGSGGEEMVGEDGSGREGVELGRIREGRNGNGKVDGFVEEERVGLMSAANEEEEEQEEEGLRG